MSHIKCFDIRFEGHYPVGAVAIVFAESEEKAKECFLLTLKTEEPHLYKRNTEDSLGRRQDLFFIVEIPMLAPSCHILLNGDY